MLVTIRHFRNAKGTRAETCPAIVSGWLMVTRRSAIGRFGPVPGNRPRSLCEVNSAQSLSPF